MKAETPRDRLDRYVTQRWGSWYRFEQQARIPHTTAVAWRKGTVPDPKRLEQLADVGLDVHWLLTGTVPPTRAQDAPTGRAQAVDPLTRAIPYLAELPPIIRSAISDLLAREGVPKDRLTERARAVWKWLMTPLTDWGFNPALDPTGARTFPGFVDYALAALGALRLSRQRALRLEGPPIALPLPSQPTRRRDRHTKRRRS
jgi:hypothetical protein